MRRAEKEIVDRREIDRIISQATVCRLAMVDGEMPYIVPLNFGYCGESLYFHSAHEGRKIDILRRGGKICFEIEGRLELVRDKNPCEWGMRYESVIGFGTPRMIDGPEMKGKALSRIMAQYSSADCIFPDHALDKTTVFAVDIESLTAKRSL